MRTSLSSKGQIVLPATLRQQDKMRAGQQFDVERIQAGEYVLRSVPGPGGLVGWLCSCPEKDWFEAVPSESTADL